MQTEFEKNFNGLRYLGRMVEVNKCNFTEEQYEEVRHKIHDAQIDLILRAACNLEPEDKTKKNNNK